MTADDDREQALRTELTDTLTASGHLRTEAWRQAVRTVPRHLFLRDGVFRRRGAGWEPITPAHPDWQALCYRDEPAVTRVAGIRPDEIGSVIHREPTHTGLAPGEAVRILEEAGIEDGMRVLLIGTGTGYTTALLSHRLGDDLVTTVEINTDIARRPRQSLAAAGHHPRVIDGDGVTGWPGALGQWDRIISTCAVITIPWLWFALLRPGGEIIAPLGGWLGATARARLTGEEGGTLSEPAAAVGRLISPAGAGLELAQPHKPPPLPHPVTQARPRSYQSFSLLLVFFFSIPHPPTSPLPPSSAASDVYKGHPPDTSRSGERPALITPIDLNDPTARFVAQAAAPWIQDIGLPDGHLYWDPEAQVWAALREHAEKWTVRQSAYPLWDRIEDQIIRWQADGSPGLEDFSVTTSADQHLLALWDTVL
ncbi:methyltransferase domain-containing protein [Streptomyces specialis]|uniref:hypothetical protein n=1 Tax=Streptomyces specialis TaxID=498367 RepID=UPI00073EFF8C|nr:hypothetical protein [Streptomyces specialis]